MRSVVALACLFAVACSESPADVGVQDSSPATDTITASETVAADDTAAVDSAHDSTQPDVADSSAVDAYTDTGMGDAVQRELCVAGSPRLTWKEDACFDGGGVLTSFYCRFRVARDGRVRCMPRDTTEVGGYNNNSTCSPLPCDGGSCSTSQLTTLTSESFPPYAMIGASPVQLQAAPTSVPWHKGTPGACNSVTTAYPYRNTSGDAALVIMYMSDAEFAAAAL